MDLADRTKLDDDVARVETARRKYPKLVVRGPTGSGRGQVLAALRADKDVVPVEAPPLSDADAPVHPLLAAAATFGPEAIDAVSDGRPLEMRVAELAARLVAAQKTLALRLPSSWRLLGANADIDPDRRVLADRARLLVDSLGRNPHLRLVILGEPGLRLDGFEMINLKPMRANLDMVADRTMWGAYGDQAAELVRAAYAAHVEMTPVQARLGVGLMGLGEGVARVIEAVRFGTVNSSLEMLEKRLVLALRREPAIAAGVVRVALARFGLPRACALSISRLPQEHASLITECLAYGDDAVAMHDRLRAALTSFAPEGLDREEAHHNLAAYHRSLDGTAAVTESPSVRDWLERAFHLGLSGKRGVDEWKTLVLPSREMYWTRARALSRSRHYAAAAAVYHDCATRFPDDDYALHYEAFNRDRDGLGDAHTEAKYRRAIELRPENAWWNARLITFLIDRSRFLAAREEWRKAVERVDPDGDGGAWLALHFHRWIIGAWLDAGEVELAREAYDAVASDALDDDRLRSLEQRLIDMEEARTMGYSVYPASYPVEDRWREPRVLPASGTGGARRVGWYPARVVEADAKRVLLAIGIPPADASARKRTALKEFDYATWTKAARTTDVPAGYWLLGSYEGGEMQAVRVESRPLEPLGDSDPLRFMKRWAARPS